MSAFYTRNPIESFNDRSRRKRRRPHDVLWSMLGLLVLVAIIVFLAAIPEFANQHTSTCTVIGKDRVATASSGHSNMRVYTSDCGTLVVGDLGMRGQWSSADIYAAIEVDHTYTITTVGWRIPIFSQFPSVLGTPALVTK